ncbi:MAG: D-alanine--D-alanine ligase, partial [Peptococcaceae bacterium]|nr:D-alanine--D-alanine ligase [Peptococcaceae bacterium]
GEDGSIQGLLELADIPYVGAGVLGSAVGMDKIIMKNLFAQAGLDQAEYLSFTRKEWETKSAEVLDQIEVGLGYPCFVKPANLGSSVGISKAHDRESLQHALALAAQFDRRIVVEEFIAGREIEVSILGNDVPVASLPGEILPCNEFYDYKAKYIDGNSGLVIPAKLPQSITESVRESAIKAFNSLDCAGLARADFFVTTKENRVLINEINTMPGFTQISMYPKLWEASGLTYPNLLDKLIELALERHAEKNKRKTSFELE